MSIYGCVWKWGKHLFPKSWRFLNWENDDNRLFFSPEKNDIDCVSGWFMYGLYVYVIETSWVFFNDATYVFFAYVLYEFHSLPSIVISDYLMLFMLRLIRCVYNCIYIPMHVIYIPIHTYACYIHILYNCIYIPMHIIIYVCVYVC